MNPLVSIIIPVYNHEKYIAECVNSALSQDYPNIEVIVVDDGSTDNTAAILKEFGGKIKYIRQANKGAAAAVNAGMRAARGELIAWLSSDDVLLPDKTKVQVQMFQKEPDLDIIHTDYIIIDAQGKQVNVARCPDIPGKQLVREILAHNFINASTILIKKECFKKVGSCNEKLRADIDADMLLRMAKYFRFGHIAQPLLKYRIHSQNITKNASLMYKSIESVRLNAISFLYAPQELFPDMGNDAQRIAQGYEQLAVRFAIRYPWLVRSANCAIRKSIEIGGLSLKRCLLSLLFKLMVIARPFFKPFHLGIWHRITQKIIK